MHVQGLLAKIKAAERGVQATQLQKAVEDDSRWVGVPPWKRELAEKKEKKKLTKADPALAVALASRSLAEKERQNSLY